MGMVLYLRRVTQKGLDVLATTTDPDSFQDLYFHDAAQRNGDIVDFDKAWHALHFLLTEEIGSSDHPLGIMLHEGEPVGQDFGYGSATLVPATMMQSFNNALRELSDEQIKFKFDEITKWPEDVYFGDWFDEEGSEGWDYIEQALPDLRSFAQRCADKGSPVLWTIS